MNKISCLLCGNFISIYVINRTLHGRLGIQILSNNYYYNHNTGCAQMSALVGTAHILRKVLHLWALCRELRYDIQCPARIESWREFHHNNNNIAIIIITIINIII